MIYKLYKRNFFILFMIFCMFGCFMVFYKEEWIILYYNIKFKFDMFCINIVVLNMFY